MACVGVDLGGVSRCELRGGVGLGLRVEVFDFGFTKDATLRSVGVGTLKGRGGSQTSRCCWKATCRHPGY